ncbi:C-terminal processing peptidase [Desulfitobacterium dichloroeliminans LMG P-21439]|uniref:C-terminal processing peptidase n=1 Tax=Desulfitobacterium dichloroeliminans (strain LMG P-21439 / DCA1) TaxID=871963 RepID=L0FAE0_DESDL|nr:C-terminal processing peptidase [Desulfitobacterium dichloroeliminans LMG P-21439]
MQESRWKEYLRNFGWVVAIASLLFTVIVGGFIVTNLDHVGRLGRVLQLIQSDYLEDVPVDTLIDGATKGIVDSLGDPYSAYMNAQENAELMQQIEGKFGGVGIILSLKDPQKLVVLRPIKNTPAAKAGLQPGDVIVKIDEVDAATIDQEKAVSLMRGDPGTQVTLVVYRESIKKSVTVPITREHITVPTVEGMPLPGNPDIAYIGISQFSSNSAYELNEVLTGMNISKYKGVILDLRYNHGGELESAVGVSSYFVQPGPIVYIVEKDGNTITKASEGNYLGIPFVVLVNEESASAAEIVSGAIRDRGTGTLVGVKTFGKGIVQTIYQLDKGTSVKLTTAKYLTPNKIDIHKKGIEPDVAVELKEGEEATLSPTTSEFDTQLREALKVLRQQL